MFQLLRRLLVPKSEKGDSRRPQSLRDANTPPAEVIIDDVVSFPVSQHLHFHEGYPIANWEAVQSWVDVLAPEVQARAWALAEQAWLLHFKVALGPEFYLSESRNATLLSSLEPNVARATLAYMERTLERVIKTLDDIAQVPPFGKDLLIVFDDDESYYKYVSYYYS